MKDRTALVVGVGSTSGLGAALARRFAEEGLKVVLAGRTRSRLQDVAAGIRKSGGKAQVVIMDVTKDKDVERLFLEIKSPQSLELVVFNVGNNEMIPSLEVKKSTFESIWRQNALGGFMVGREAIRLMLAQQRGTLIFTGATASLRAKPPFVAFASAKAALRGVAQGFAREFGPQGIHVAHVVIDGVLDGDYARTKFPEFTDAKGEDGLINIEEAAQSYWFLHKQPRSAWTHELDLRPFKEPF